MIDLKSKIAVVTGGTQGLGAEIARLFAERGASGLVTCGRNKEKGATVAEQISKDHACKVHFVEADLAKVEDCQNVVAEADKVFGRVDTLVNVAALTDRGNILNTSPELFDRMIAINLRAPFFLMQGVTKIMIRESIQGSIVNIGSTSEMGGQPFIAAYCASKGGLETLTRNTAYALMRNRIRVNQLNPGWMSTEGEDRVQKEFHDAEDNWLQEAAAKQPFGRLVDPAEVARAAAFLASDESGMMTGNTVNIDQCVWGAYDSSPQPEKPMPLED